MRLVTIVPHPASRRNGENMKKFVILVVFIALFTSTPSFAGIYELEVMASRSDLEARYCADLPLEKGILSTGLGVIYRNEDYWIADMKLTLGEELWAPGLRLHIGLKGLVGEVERDQNKGGLTAVGVLVSARYSIPPTISPLPLGVSAGVSFAPEFLCFSDAERYLDVRTSLDFRVAKNGEILLGYRCVHARLEDDRVRWKISDATLFIGYRLSY
jgi:hypothetical protein